MRPASTANPTLNDVGTTDLAGARTGYPTPDVGTQDRAAAATAGTIDPTPDVGTANPAGLLVAMDAATAKDVPFASAAGVVIHPDMLVGIASLRDGTVLVTETPLAGYDPDGYGAKVRDLARSKDVAIRVVSPRSVDNLRRDEGLDKDDVTDAQIQLRLHLLGRSWPLRGRRKNGDQIKKGINDILVPSRRVGYDDEIGRWAQRVAKAAGVWDGKGKCPALYIKAAVAARFVRGLGLGFRTYRFAVGNYERGRNQQVRASFYHDAMPTVRAAVKRAGRVKHTAADRKAVWRGRSAAVKAVWRAA